MHTCQSALHRNVASGRRLYLHLRLKLAILQNTISQLEEAGYVYIGMDHFAKPTDELAIAQQQGQLP